MRIAIISDTHDNLNNLDKALQYIRGENIRMIIHCGDVCSKDTLDYLVGNFKGKLIIVRGNADLYDVIPVKTGIQDVGSPTRLPAGKCRICQQAIRLEDDNNNIKIFDKYGEIQIDGKTIKMVHNKKDIPNHNMPNTIYQIPDTIFYGHTHKPWIEKIGKIIVANPGNVAGIHYAPTFAVYETNNNKLELKILDKL